MTQRERMQVVINHEKPDRTPAVLAGRAEVHRALVEHYGVEDMADVHRILGTDGWNGAGVALDWFDYNSRVDGELIGDFPYAGGKFIMHGEDVFEDQWRVVRKAGEDRKYVQWLSGPISGENPDLDAWGFPGPDRIIPNPDLPQRVQELKDKGYWVQAGVAMPYKTAWEARGMENLLADYLLNPGLVEAIYDRIFALCTAMLIPAVEAGVDQIGVGGDIAMQDRMIMGAEAWRRIDRPRLAAMIDRCKEINPDVHVFIHSDGDLDEIMDDLIEIGFDIIDPIQPECMDPFEVKRRYGDRIVLHGCGSLQKVLPFGTVADVRKHVTDLIEKCGYNGGLVLRVSNAIGFDVPTENTVAFFETARDYDMSQL
ncbi:MAG TPA: uroporphyrinogen decarboxylase family protein [Armatimonadota bacterium]|nr:uroporphyrinogen decarboxylase family protein [Armatimonadota bacterium]